MWEMTHGLTTVHLAALIMISLIAWCLRMAATRHHILGITSTTIWTNISAQCHLIQYTRGQRKRGSRRQWKDRYSKIAGTNWIKRFTELLAGSTSSVRKWTLGVLSLRGTKAMSIRYSHSISLSDSVASPSDATASSKDAAKTDSTNQLLPPSTTNMEPPAPKSSAKMAACSTPRKASKSKKRRKSNLTTRKTDRSRSGRWGQTRTFRGIAMSMPTKSRTTISTSRQEFTGGEQTHTD